MKIYIGKCVSGPLHGKDMAHFAKTKVFYRPLYGRMDGPPELTNIGEYRLNDFGQWHWWATPEGKAMDVLFGEVL